MKKLFLLAMLCLSAQAFAQVCEVDMVDRYNRVVRVFRAYGDPNTCLDGMKECRKAIRLDPYSGGVDCIRRGYNPQPNPNPYPNPNPNPYPNPYPRDVNYYLSMSDFQLAQEAIYGIGRCNVAQGNYTSACQFYMKVNGVGIGGGTGCAREEYTRQYGCYNYNEFENAGCLVRFALRQRLCL